MCKGRSDSLSPSPPPSLLLQFLGSLSINNVPKTQQILFLLLLRMPGIWGEMREMGTRKPLKLIITEAPGSRDGLFSCINYKGLEIKGGECKTGKRYLWLLRTTVLKRSPHCFWALPHQICENEAPFVGLVYAM